MLRCLGGNSPFLADLAMREPATIRAIIANGPDAVAQAAFQDLADIAPTLKRERLAAALRRAKRIIALATAIADIGGIWPLERVTATLTDLAETALSLAVAHLLRAAHDAGELRLPDPCESGTWRRVHGARHGQARRPRTELFVAMSTSCCCTTRPRQYTRKQPRAMRSAASPRGWRAVWSR